MLAAGRWTRHRELAVLVGAKTATVSRHLSAIPGTAHEDRGFLVWGGAPTPAVFFSPGTRA